MELCKWQDAKTKISRFFKKKVGRESRFGGSAQLASDW